MTAALALTGLLALAFLTVYGIERGQQAAHAQRFDIARRDDERARRHLRVVK